MLGRSVSRRLLLRHLSLGAGAVVLGGQGLIRGGVARAESATHWDYPEADDWSKLSPEFAACGGHRQSPVDLGAARPLRSESLALHWSGFAGDLTHNGHTLQVSPRQGEDGGFLELGGKMFKFLQFHLHHPSEHALAGKRWPLELHAVHQAADGTLAVIGILFRPGREHDGLGNVLTTLPQTGQSRAMTKPVDVFAFLPRSAAAYFYQGSLTTPPCSEIVSWIVLRDPVEAGIGQIETLTRAFPMNARPLQSGAGRLIGIDLF